MAKAPRTPDTRIDAPTRYTLPVLTALAIIATTWALVKFNLTKPVDETLRQSALKALCLVWLLVAANWLLEFFRKHRLRKKARQIEIGETEQKEQQTTKKTS